MNLRSCTVGTLRFGKPEIIPLDPGCGRRSTIERWKREGLPEDAVRKGIAEFAYRQAGGTLQWPSPARIQFSVNERMIPQFEEKIIEERQTSIIVQDWKGNICEIGREFTPEHLRNAVDFVTRRWIKCPVETRTDWEAMKLRYDPSDSSRISALGEDDVARLMDRDYFIELHFSGPFWQLREWLGFENLCMMFHDDPAFLDEMISFWGDYISELLKDTLKRVLPDSVHISEDMAYKSFSMISPEMARRHLLPQWRRWGEIIRNSGVPLYSMDSDGFIGELIPIWIEAGINACDPIEVAAGNDIVELRRRFRREMAFRGGVDKRKIAMGGRAIEEEIGRISSVIEDGGFIPSCDHGVPSDVSWPDFVHYTKVLAKATGWL